MSSANHAEMEHHTILHQTCTQSQYNTATKPLKVTYTYLLHNIPALARAGPQNKFITRQGSVQSLVACTDVTSLVPASSYVLAWLLPGCAYVHSQRVISKQRKTEVDITSPTAKVSSTRSKETRAITLVPQPSLPPPLALLSPLPPSPPPLLPLLPPPPTPPLPLPPPPPSLLPPPPSLPPLFFLQLLLLLFPVLVPVLLPPEIVLICMEALKYWMAGRAVLEW